MTVRNNPPRTPWPAARPSPWPSPWPGPDAPLARAVRRALAGPPGRVALRLAAAGPHRRRAARLLLRDAARAGGGQLLEGAAGELLLLGAAAAEAERALDALAGLGPGPGCDLWHLPADSAPLLAWAEAVAPAASSAPGLAGLDAALDGLRAGQVASWRAVLRLGGGQPSRLAFHRLVLSRHALGAAMGELAEDPDLLAHAEDRVARRLAATVPPAGAPPMLPLPPGGAPPPPPAPGAIGVLPLESLADPGAFARRTAMLAAAGWGLALEGMDALSLGLVAPVALPAGTTLLLRWSPALGDRVPLQALRRLDPARLVLTGCEGAAALGWGLEQGIARFAGPAVESLLRAARSAA